MPNSETILADCNRVLPWFFDFQFYLGIHDPPYFSGPEKRGHYGSKISSTGVMREPYAKTETWELPTVQWFEEVKRVCRYWIIWGANYFDFIGEPFPTPRRHELEEFIRLHPKGWIIWDKCNGKTSFNDYELAYTNMDFDTVVIKFMWNGMQQARSIKEGHRARGDKKNNEKRIHPTQKPVPLYIWQLQTFAIPGCNVLDLYLGSGSHRIAAYDLDIDFTGVEMYPTYYYVQEQRFIDHISQIKIAI